MLLFIINFLSLYDQDLFPFIVIFFYFKPDKQLYPDVKETNNNGLEYTVEVLEEIYTNPDFPLDAPSLSVSLRDSGKSRADLWAYATVLAVEYGVETNNIQCDAPSNATISGPVRPN